jgi:hypothetical protein
MYMIYNCFKWVGRSSISTRQFSIVKGHFHWGKCSVERKFCKMWFADANWSWQFSTFNWMIFLKSFLSVEGNLSDFFPLCPTYWTDIFRVNFHCCQCGGGGGSTKTIFLVCWNSSLLLHNSRIFKHYIAYVFFLKLFPPKFARLTFIICPTSFWLRAAAPPPPPPSRTPRGCP